MSLFFNKTKNKSVDSKELTVDVLKNEFPDLFSSIVNEANALSVLNATPDAIKGANEKLFNEIKSLGLNEAKVLTDAEHDRVTKITAYAGKIGVAAECIQHCIDNKLSVADAAVYCLDNKTEQNTAIDKSKKSMFNQAVPTGEACNNGGTDDPFTTFEEAMSNIMKTENCSAEKARILAVNKYPKLFEDLMGRKNEVPRED